MLILDRNSKTPLYLQIYEQIREKIISGKLHALSRLPSIRQQADTLGVSINTVTLAYQQLCSEGYITSKNRSGFYAEKIDDQLLNLRSRTGKQSPALETKKDAQEPHCKYDFSYGNLSPQDFPLSIWRKLSNQLLTSSNLDHICSYPDRRGEAGLRKAIMQYLHDSRGVFCEPEQIVICPGTQIALNLVCQLLKQEHSCIAMEDPGYDGARVVFHNNGLEIIPIGLEKDGLRLRDLEVCKAKLVYTTPSHQFPTGKIMPIKKRIRLLEWAFKNNAMIIEDDYDSELKYSGKPIPSIQHIDAKGHVVYLGTFSKSLSPALRMSYMVMPKTRIKKYQKIFERYNTPVPWLDQKLMQNFITKGYWDRHLRRIRNANKKRHDVLIQAISETMGENVAVHGINAGLHILLEFKAPGSETEMIKKAMNHGVRVYPVSEFWMRSERYKNNMVLLGFSRMDENEIAQGIKTLDQAWFKN